MSQIVTSSGTQELKERFKAVRDELMEHDLITHAKFEAFVIEKESVYNSKEGIKKIHDVYYGRSSSLNLLEMIEMYMEQFENLDN